MQNMEYRRITAPAYSRLIRSNQTHYKTVNQVNIKYVLNLWIHSFSIANRVFNLTYN